MFGKKSKVLFKVRFTGRNVSSQSSPDLKKLNPGKVYQVVSVQDRGLKTDYTLLEVKGTFDSSLFEDV